MASAPALSMRILLIKTSSLGDVVHNLPVVADLRRQFPSCRIDWVVEEAFAGIPRLHPGVDRVIPVALRRWRHALTRPDTRKEFALLKERFGSVRYNLAIDTQGLLKSALLARMVHARRCGYAWGSAREPLASLFYDENHSVEIRLHAVERNRHLAAACCGYTVENPPDYGIAVAPAPTPGPARAVLLTATSRDDKLWPEERWIALGLALRQRGLVSLLPSGSPSEQLRADRIARGIPDAETVPPGNLEHLAGLLAAAKLVVGVDTGLVHLAAALGRPTIAMFVATDPALTGVLAATPFRNLGTKGAPPTVEATLSAVAELL